MKIIPGPTDAKLLETDPGVKLKEERIRAGRWDENEELRIEGNVLRMEEKNQGNIMLRMEEKNKGNIDSVLEELRLERQEICA
jgi:DNA/RNA endonuclease YhcR with UshA esterase domain